MSGWNCYVKPAGFHSPKLISTSSLSRSRIKNIRAISFSHKNHPMPAPISSSIYWDNRIGFNRAPMAERPFLGGNTQFPKGTSQLVVAGVRLFVFRLKNTFFEISLRLQIRLPSYHCHAGDSTTGFIHLSHTFHPKSGLGLPPGIPSSLAVHLGTEVVPHIGSRIAGKKKHHLRSAKIVQLYPGCFFHNIHHPLDLLTGTPTLPASRSCRSTPSPGPSAPGARGSARRSSRGTPTGRSPRSRDAGSGRTRGARREGNWTSPHLRTRRGPPPGARPCGRISPAKLAGRAAPPAPRNPPGSSSTPWGLGGPVIGPPIY